MQPPCELPLRELWMTYKHQSRPPQHKAPSQENELKYWKGLLGPEDLFLSQTLEVWLGYCRHSSQQNQTGIPNLPNYFSSVSSGYNLIYLTRLCFGPSESSHQTQKKLEARSESFFSVLFAVDGQLAEVFAWFPIYPPSQLKNYRTASAVRQHQIKENSKDGWTNNKFQASHAVCNFSSVSYRKAGSSVKLWSTG